MLEDIYVVGHRNPDTDSICAAISYARFKQRLGVSQAIPCRAGKINRETEFVLNAFGVEVPMLLNDLQLRVKDLLSDPVPTVQARTSIEEAWKVMKSTKQKTLPVVDRSERMIGMLTVGDLSGAYIDSMADIDFDGLHIPLRNVVRTLNGTLLVGDEERELTGKVYIGAMHSETIEDYVPRGSIMIMGNRPVAQETALRLGVSALILTGGARLSPELELLARVAGTVVISVPFDTFTVARLLPMSVPVKRIMQTEGIVSFQDDDLIAEVRQKMLDTRYRNYPVLDDDGKIVGLISRYHLLSLSRKKVILVDHNEFGQGVKGADQAQVLEVIDHHRVGGIQTGEPIFFRNEPVGSTCTIVGRCYQDHGLLPEKHIAGIMLGAILSDTVLFKSPTCTETDRRVAFDLAEIAGVDLKEFGTRMFKAASNLSERKLEDLIQEDLKEFAIGDYRMGIGQFSVMGMEGLEEIRPELMAKMDDLRHQKEYDNLLLMATDLLEENTELLITGGQQEKIAEVFGQPLTEQSILLPNVLSRKKQVVPPLSRFFAG